MSETETTTTTTSTPATDKPKGALDGFLLGGELRVLCEGGHELGWPFENPDALAVDKADLIFSDDIGCPGCTTPTEQKALPAFIAVGNHVTLVEDLLEGDERARELGAPGGLLDLLALQERLAAKGLLLPEVAALLEARLGSVPVPPAGGSVAAGG